ncbi:MAG: hypothetical protein KC503_07305 [Myxococcales bacterium]|nr:hypothetical protein [Myxococcales bacterium]
MSLLSWLVAHGVAVWVTGLVVFVVLGMLWAWSRPRRRMARKVARARKTLGEPRSLAPSAAGEEITLVGTLRCVTPDDEAAPVLPDCQRLEDQRTAAVSSAAAVEDEARSVSLRASSLAVDVGGIAVELDGDVDVLVGSRERLPGRRVGRTRGDVAHRVWLAAGGTETFDARQHLVYRSLQPGDRVRVRGRLERVAAVGDDELGYRELGGRWRLTCNGETPVKLAYEGRPQRVGPDHSQLGIGAAVGVIAFAMAFLPLGELSLRRATADPERLQNGLLDAVPGERNRRDLSVAFAIASATPLHRARALANLERTLDRACAFGEATFTQRVQLSRMRGDCRHTVRLMLVHRRYEDALGEQLRCGDPTPIHTLLKLGEIAAASSALAAHPPETPADRRRAAVVHLLVGDHTAATSLLRQRGSSATERCIADALDVAFGNDVDAARARLRRRARPSIATPLLAPTSRPCALLWLASVAPEARKQLPPSLGVARDPLHERALALLLLEAGHDPSDARVTLPPLVAPEKLLLRLTTRSTRRTLADIALRRAVYRGLISAQPTTSRRRYRARLALELARDELALDNGERALSLTRAALADFKVLAAETDVARDVRFARAQLAAVLTRLGHALEAKRVVDTIAESPEKRAIAALLSIKLDGSMKAAHALGLLEAEDQLAWRYAADGDGTKLARLLCQYHDDGARFLLLARHLQNGAEHLRRWARWGDIRHESEPLREVLRRVIVARATGDRTELSRARDILKRYREALSDRRISLPLMLLGGLP